MNNSWRFERKVSSRSDERLSLETSAIYYSHFWQFTTFPFLAWKINRRFEHALHQTEWRLNEGYFISLWWRTFRSNRHLFFTLGSGSSPLSRFRLIIYTAQEVYTTKLILFFLGITRRDNACNKHCLDTILYIKISEV